MSSCPSTAPKDKDLPLDPERLLLFTKKVNDRLNEWGFVARIPWEGGQSVYSALFEGAEAAQERNLNAKERLRSQFKKRFGQDFSSVRMTKARFNNVFNKERPHATLSTLRIITRAIFCLHPDEFTFGPPESPYLLHDLRISPVEIEPCNFSPGFPRRFHLYEPVTPSLLEVDEKISNGLVFFVGDYGSGRSTAAIEYAHSRARQFRHVIYTQAPSLQEFQSQLIKMAGWFGVDVDGKRTLTEKYQEIQENWFEVQENWLLIVANCANSQEIVELLPATSRGKIIVTTTFPIHSQWGETVAFGDLEFDAGAYLFMRYVGFTPRLKPEETLQDRISALRDDPMFPVIRDIAEALQGWLEPICEAAQYGGSSPETCLAELRKKMLPVVGNKTLLRRKGVKAVIELVLESVIKSPGGETSYALALLCSLLNGAEIQTRLFALGEKPLTSPEARLLSKFCRRHHVMQGTDPDPKLPRDTIPSPAKSCFGDSESPALAIANLVTHRLLSEAPDQVRMSHLKAETLRALAPPEMLQSLALGLACFLSELVSFTTLESWDDCRPIAPHAATLTEHAISLKFLGEAYASVHAEIETELGADQLGEYNDPFVVLVNQVSNYNLEIGDYRSAESLLQLGDRLSSILYPGDHPSKAVLLYNTGWSHYKLGLYEKAFQEMSEAVAMDERVLDGKNKGLEGNLCVHLDGLAKVLSRLARYEEAFTRAEESYRLNKPLVELGVRHGIELAFRLSTMAAAKRDLREYDAAREYQLKCIDFIKRYADGQEQLLPLAQCHLASILIFMGQFDEAHALLNHSNEKLRLILGPRHPYCADPPFWLGWLFLEQGHEPSARGWWEEAYRMKKEGLGADHAETRKVRKLLEAL